MGKIFLVPVGEQMKPLYEGFRYVKNIEQVYLICSDYTRKMAKEMKDKLSAVYKIEVIETKAERIDDIIDDIITAIKDFKNKRIISNISGGTKIMSLACYIISSYTEGFSFYIFKDEKSEMKYVEVPSLKINIDLFVKNNSKKFKLLEKLSKKDYFLNQLSKELNIKSSTTNAHIYTLERTGMVKTERMGRKLIIKITTTGKLIYSLVKLKHRMGVENDKNLR
ncbi:hypothetical protein DRH29_02665 [candidate division Kazan bacterium]|uniref:HFX-2341-like N-terminal domain-containing protein n=1 Tax=candidate division Kazan bacterium TaxID=2202143 RepID=A0A420ZCQ7_UNCK3|nr:MAG: hypothetical protein DRH29_02665 [candidate division Kazan bacterium]